MRDLVRGLLDLIYPPPIGCPLCGSGRERDLCRGCLDMMAPLMGLPHCSVCGRFAISVAEQNPCHTCRTTALPFLLNRSVAPHEGIFRDLIHALKYGRRISLAEPLGRKMACVAQSEAAYQKAEVIVPIPLAPDRLRERRFNQSLLLAQAAGRILGLRVSEALERQGQTPHQTGMDAVHRRANVKGVFMVSRTRTIHGKTVILVDDVFTTGSTIAEASRVLLSGGAAQVLSLTFTTGTR
ncbi:MAG: ComF family protein [Eubacteriales bacterium]|nr:ComF family protein [Bacillota bacterium]MBV1728447.1 ComF family protein [Desulforudis sp.]MDQ7788831.1 ComF family protein [Clostridia bacterium]MDZ4043992.1 ComF family protein [Eubacteriales bacterium]MBU4533060.1 ComF family protein [Bacillota bacterium]